MKQTKRAAAFHAAAGLIMLLAAAAELWLRRPGQGLLLLAAGWGYVTRNLFKAGRTYGTERAWAPDPGGTWKAGGGEKKAVIAGAAGAGRAVLSQLWVRGFCAGGGGVCLHLLRGCGAGKRGKR